MILDCMPLNSFTVHFLLHLNSLGRNKKNSELGRYTCKMYHIKARENISINIICLFIEIFIIFTFKKFIKVAYNIQI